MIFAGTASKTLAPGLRLAWLVLPHAATASELPVRGVAAGLHLVVELPERDLVRRARDRSLELDGLTPFWHRQDLASAGLVLNDATPPEHAYARTLTALAEVLGERRLRST